MLLFSSQLIEYPFLYLPCLIKLLNFSFFAGTLLLSWPLLMLKEIPFCYKTERDFFNSF
ncbi:hypothetical protein KIS4809_0064 [Bacillus sp. ZZV12-4809]|nr:hypothetical protein KIS4809_0064 [Bacillus sp. ZZV12-4809]